MQKLSVYTDEKIMEITVGMGEMKSASSPDILKAVGIGSCIAVILYDKKSKTASMSHIMIPYIKESQDKNTPGRFADMAIGIMINQMRIRGIKLKNLKAMIYGGANMFPGIISPGGTMDIGKRNILAVKDELKKYNIKIINQDTGGHIGRTVLFNTKNSSVIVKTIHTKNKVYVGNKHEA